jgi:hypothetical protein
MPRRIGVADAVNDLPLAVEQAGALLADTGIPVDKYLRLLVERAQDVLDHDPGGAYPQSVVASWAVAFDRLAADDPAALDLLTLVAWCGAEPVALSLITDHPDALPAQFQPIATDPLGCWHAAPRSCNGGAWRRCPPTASSCTGFQLRCSAPAVTDRLARRLPAGRRPLSDCSTRPHPPTCATTPARGHYGGNYSRTCWRSRPR